PLFMSLISYYFNDYPSTETYTLSLHDALPICHRRAGGIDDAHRIDFADEDHAGSGDHVDAVRPRCRAGSDDPREGDIGAERHQRDRKSTRLNSSHVAISYAVFCLKKKIYKHNS